MKVRYFHIILGIVLSFFTMQAGMANTAVLQEEVSSPSLGRVEGGACESHKQTTFSLDDFGLLPELISAEQSEFSFSSEEESESQTKRFSKYGRSLQFHFSSTFFANRASKGVATHPGTQDPLQERTATIQFLQQASLIC